MAAGRELFDALLKGSRPARPPFAPLLAGVAARVGGISRRSMTADPALWAGAVGKAAELFELDGVAVGFDSTLAAEACGCPVSWEEDRPRLAGGAGSLAAAPEAAGRMGVALEAAARAFSVCRSRRGCVAVLTGPVTLADQLFGPEAAPRLNDAKQASLRLTEAFCKLRPDLLVFLEGEALTRAGGLPPAWRRTYGTVRNVAQYYDVPVAVRLEDVAPGELGPFLPLGADLLVAGRPAEGVANGAGELGELSESPLGVGVSLPLADAAEAGAVIGAWRSLAGSGRAPAFFFTGADAEGAPVDPDVLRAVSRAARS